MHIVVDGQRVSASAGESLLLAMLRADLHPTGGGCLCLGGDCPHCLVSVDGVSYVRACQEAPREGMAVERHHRHGSAPPLPSDEPAADTNAVPARHVHCDVVVIGQGAAGREAADQARSAGKSVVTIETRDGQEAVGIYAGPLVVARTAGETLQAHVHDQVVIATGAAEIQPVAPGSELDGLLTARAATTLARAGFDLGRVIAVGQPPEGVEAERVDGEIVRFEGDVRVSSIVVLDPDRGEIRHECDTVSLGLGLHPRDTLVRMANGLPPHPCGTGASPITVVGDAARRSDIPPCPRAGTVCPCSQVEVSDLDSVWERGFRELELVKRATLAGTGTCQGSVCLPHVRSLLRAKGKELQPPFTARPVTRQLTLGEIASGAYHPPTPRTPLHDEHLRLGAQMERSGGWWRPWSYGDRTAEYRAARERVSIGDVSTLGKFLVSGADAEAFLDFLYPTTISTLRSGRSRYALLLDERGFVLDDGLVCRDGETRFTLTLTSAGSTFGELWLRDWAEAKGFDVQLMNQTMSLGAINVTGPRAAELLAWAGAEQLPGFARHHRLQVAGVDCRVYRLSFTGELSYELHHAASDSVALWRRLLELGAEFDIVPHGLEVLLDLRLEKGHIVVGQDTEFDSTPRRIHHDWAVKLAKDDFIGRQAVVRTGRTDLDKQLVGLETELPAPEEGAILYAGDRWVGRVTSSGDAHVLGKAVMLAWLYRLDGELPEVVTVEGRTARRVPLPFYDPNAERARAEVSIPPNRAIAGSWPTPSVPAPTGRFERLEATRIVAAPDALDAARWPEGASVLRIAPDEVLVTSEVDPEAIDDPHAILERETGFSVARLAIGEAAEALARSCAWKLPDERPAFAQGAIAEVPTKLLLERERVHFFVQTPFARDLEERLQGVQAALHEGGDR